MADMGFPQLCDINKVPAPGSYSTDQGKNRISDASISVWQLVGNVTQVCPGFHPIYTIPTEDGASNHTHEFTKAAATSEAHRLTIATAKGMAGTAWRVLVDDEFAKNMREEFEKERKEKE
jgi:hypothetical protein